jgi:hypothetical protein
MYYNKYMTLITLIWFAVYIYFSQTNISKTATHQNKKNSTNKTDATTDIKG